MAHFSTKSELLTAIYSERGRLEKKIAGLRLEEMARPGAMGEWSVKDILAHLVDWEQRLSAGTRQASAVKRPKHRRPA